MTPCYLKLKMPKIVPSKVYPFINCIPPTRANMYEVQSRIWAYTNEQNSNTYYIHLIVVKYGQVFTSYWQQVLLSIISISLNRLKLIVTHTCFKRVETIMSTIERLSMPLRFFKINQPLWRQEKLKFVVDMTSSLQF